VSDADGLIGIVDVLFDEARVVVEIDGRAYHSDDVAFQRDRTRQNRLMRAGYLVLRFTWDDVVARPDEIVALVRHALDGRASDASHRVRGA
jgi:very-short-patch-repair endonuclease